nr:hypothetical protein [uncultured Holophaga sp.]
MHEHPFPPHRPWRRGLPFLLLLLAALLVMGLAVHLLWNALMPSILGVRPLHYGQALGLLILTRLLVGGWSRGPLPLLHRRHRPFQRWDRMGPEERERFRQGLRHRGHGAPPHEHP